METFRSVSDGELASTRASLGLPEPESLTDFAAMAVLAVLSRYGVPLYTLSPNNVQSVYSDLSAALCDEFFSEDVPDVAEDEI